MANALVPCSQERSKTNRQLLALPLESAKGQAQKFKPCLPLRIAHQVLVTRTAKEYPPQLIRKSTVTSPLFHEGGQLPKFPGVFVYIYKATSPASFYTFLTWNNNPHPLSPHTQVAPKL